MFAVSCRRAEDNSVLARDVTVRTLDDAAEFARTYVGDRIVRVIEEVSGEASGRAAGQGMLGGPSTPPGHVFLLECPRRPRGNLAAGLLAGCPAVVPSGRGSDGPGRPYVTRLCVFSTSCPAARPRRIGIRFRRPPPQHVDADCTHHDRCEDKTRNREANANSHDCWSLLLCGGA